MRTDPVHSPAQVARPEPTPASNFFEVDRAAKIAISDGVVPDQRLGHLSQNSPGVVSRPEGPDALINLTHLSTAFSQGREYSRSDFCYNRC